MFPVESLFRIFITVVLEWPNGFKRWFSCITCFTKYFNMTDYAMIGYKNWSFLRSSISMKRCVGTCIIRILIYYLCYFIRRCVLRNNYRYQQWYHRDIWQLVLGSCTNILGMYTNMLKVYTIKKRKSEF